MKKQFAILGVIVLGVIATLLMPSTAFAKGETFSFSGSSSASGNGGTKIVVSGGAFKSETTFTKVSDSEAQKYGARVSGYSVYYKTDSFNLKDDATTYVPACRKDPAFIALKSAEGTKGLLYPAPTNSSGVQTGCAAAVGMNFNNLSEQGSQYSLQSENNIKPDAAWLAVLEGNYNALASAVSPLKNAYYTSLGSRAPCSSQGCDDSTWKGMVGLCWQNARASSADAARYAGSTYDIAKGTKEAFSNCLAGKSNGAFTAAQTLDVLRQVDVGAVNSSGSAAGDTARSELEAANAPKDETADPQTSCVIEGVGWIVCPITNFLAGVSDASFSVISNFLRVNVKLLDTTSGTYAAWTTFRNLANVAFVIVFMIIIYSQLTGQGVSNYGVKKTLPRLVVAAILVNISFFVCQIAVDVTQIIGGAIGGVFNSIPIGVGEVAVPKWTDVMGDVLMGAGIAALAIGGAAAGIAMLTLSISVPVMLAALLAILMTVIILVGRQAGIVILIILSPLAFVAFMLPNTEKWFKKWYQAFIALLMVFPIVALLYGGGQLTSKIISSVANSSGTDASMKFWLSITAIAVAAIPLIMTPSLLKAALNGMGSVGGKLSGFANRANGNVRKSANTSSRYGEAKQGLKNRFALSRANRRANSNIQGKIDSSPVGRYLGLNKGAARAVNTLMREDEEGVDAVVSQMKLKTNSQNRVSETTAYLKEAIANGDTTRARAAQRILLQSGNVGLKSLQGVYSDPSMQGALQQAGSKETVSQLRSDINGAGLKGKNNALARYGYEESIGHHEMGKLIGDENTYSSLNSVELAGQDAKNLEQNQHLISPTAAAAVLANDDASALLDDKKRTVFQAAARGVTAPAAPIGSASSSPGAPSTTTSGTPTVTTPGATPPTAPATTASPVVAPADGGLTIPHEATPSAPVDPYDARTAQRATPPADPSQMAPEWRAWHEQEARRKAAAQPGTPAAEARTATNEHGQQTVVGQHEDTIDRMSR